MATEPLSILPINYLLESEYDSQTAILQSVEFLQFQMGALKRSIGGNCGTHIQYSAVDPK